MELTRFWRGFIGWMLGAVGLVMLVASLLPREWLTPPTVQAQGAGSANFTRTFTLAASGSSQYIPACTSSGANCIPNYTQASQTVSYTFSSSHTNCSILIDGSNDNTVWQTIGSDGNIAQSNTGTFGANGAYGYHRIKFAPCSSAITLVYTGFGLIQPVTPLGFQVAKDVGAVTVLFNYNYSPAVLQSFQCSNPAASAAYLQLFSNGSTPTLGTNYFYQTEIPAGSVFTYPGPSISLYSVNLTATYNIMYAGAATTAGGSTAVSTAINCNFQSQGTGPYYPFNPPSS